MEFIVGVYSPCLARHGSRNLRLAYHVDDCCILGAPLDLEWFRGQLDLELITKVRGLLGPDEGQVRDITLLNRIVRYTPGTNGRPQVEWESDPRHVEIITATLGLRSCTTSKGVACPGVNRSLEDTNAATDLSPEAASHSGASR